MCNAALRRTVDPRQRSRHPEEQLMRRLVILVAIVIAAMAWPNGSRPPAAAA